MDSAYDADEIRACSLRLGHVPLIEPTPRRNRELKAELHSSRRADRAARHVPAETARMRERSTVERFFGRLKDQFGAKHARVRGNKKVFCHLMFGADRPADRSDDAHEHLNRLQSLITAPGELPVSGRRSRSP